MGRTCCVYRCPSRSFKDCGIHFFQFPYKRPKIYPRWISAIRRKNFTPTKNHSVCSVHFTDDDYAYTHSGRLRKQLKACAVPSIFPTFPSYYQPKEKRPRTSVTSSGKRTSSIATPSKSISPSSIATPSKCISTKVQKFGTVEKDKKPDHASGKRKLLKKISEPSTGNRPSVSTGSDRIRPKVEQSETVEEESNLSETDQTYVSRQKLLKEISEASIESDSVSPSVEQFEIVEENSRLSETDGDDPLNILRQSKLPKNSGSRSASSSNKAENRPITPKVEIFYELVEHATVLSEDKGTQTDEKRPAPKAESQEKHLRHKLKTLQQKARRQEVEIGNLKILVAPLRIKKEKKPDYLKNGKPVIVILP